MNKNMKAKIHWIPFEKGGRKKPPFGPKGTKYTTIAHFLNDPIAWPSNQWSLVVQFEEPSCNGELDIIATVWFLSDAAPQHFLEPGNLFELYEGAHMIATGEILEG